MNLNFTAIDLFSGPGGMTLGMKEAGITPIFAVEKRPDAVFTYLKHSPNIDHHCGDIREIDFEIFRNKANIVYGGPPCQPFSTGGLRLGENDPRDMIPQFIRAVDQIQPEAFVMENVPGLASAKRSLYFRDALDKLSKLGFQISWRILNSAHYGVPQNRKRLFIVGLRDSEFHFPLPTHGPDTDQDVVPGSSVVSLDSPFGTPPTCEVRYAKFPDLRPSPYSGQLYNGGGRPLDLNKPSFTILASAGGYKTHWVDTQNIAPKYHKHLQEGGEPWTGSVPGARRLTIEESALLQSFPQWLTFHGKISSQYTQIGDAVPPLLACKIGSSLTAQINGNLDESMVYPATQPQLLWT